MVSAVTGRALLSLLLLLSLGTAPVAVATALPEAGPSGGGDQSVGSVQLAPNNTTTPQHRNPDTVGENGDTDALQGWLERQLGSSLRESTVQISQGEYERGRALVGDEYDSYLSQYVDVAGETDSSVDDETGDRLQEARESQREYANTSEEFEETYDEYEEAKQNGNEARARELARELDALSRSLSETSGDLTANYENLGNVTGQDFSDSQGQIEAVTENVSNRTEAVREAEFTQTRLAVDAESQSVSFTDPLTLTGQLTAADNTTLPDTAVLRVGAQRQAVDLGTNGEFTLEYQPVRLATDATSLDVKYVPAASSVFFPSNDTVPVTVESVTPTVDLSPPTGPVGYGDTVTVSGAVSVDGDPVPNTRVVLLVDGARVGQARTDADGRVTMRTTLDETVPAGEASLSLRAGQDGLAVSSGTVNGTFTVRESPTALSLQTDRSAESVNVSGTLTTADGDAIPGQTVALAVNGTTVGTATTDEQGHYATNLDVPQSESDSVSLVARFDGTGTNLASASEQQSLRALQTGGSESTSLWLLAGGAVAVLAGLLLVVGLFVVDVRSVLSPGPDDDQLVDGTVANPGSSAEAGDTDAGTAPDRAPLADRIDALVADADDDPDGAVIRAYLEVRETLGPDLALGDTATHSDFYRAVTAERPALQVPVGQLVGAFEVAAFADRSVTQGEARAVLEDVRAVCTEDGIDGSSHAQSTAAGSGGDAAE